MKKLYRAIAGTALALSLWGTAGAAVHEFGELPPPPLPPAATQFRTYGSGIPLAEFLKITLGSVLRQPYVLTPAAASETSLISADLTHVKKGALKAVLKDVLQAAGFEMRETGGVIIVDKLTPGQLAMKGDIVVYAPKHRSVAALSSFFPMFPNLSFSYGATLSSNAAGSTSNAGAVGGTAGGGSDFATGAMGYSQVDGNPSVLAIRGESKAIAEFKAFLAKIDIPVPEVLVRAYVFEVRDTARAETGMSVVMSLLGDKLSMSFGTLPGVSATDGMKLTFAPGVSFSAVLSNLSGDSRVKLVTAPILRAADGSRATAIIGTDTPTLGAVTTTQGTATQSITYQQSGVILTVAPQVYENNVRLKIAQEVSSFAATDTGVKDSPTKLRRSFDADVVATWGEVVLLGGLSDTKSTEAKKSMFGGLFGGSSSEETASEIVVMLTIEKA